MRIWWLIPLALPLMAASPPRRLTLAVPTDSGSPVSMATSSFTLGSPTNKPVYEPAPLPDRDIRAPRDPRASQAPNLAPTLFTQREQYRGDGFSPGSTPQGEQEHRLHPAAGFSLHMPLQPD